MRRRHSMLLFVVLVALLSVGCRKEIATNPAPPAPTVQRPPAPSPAITLRAMPAVVSPGESVALQWEAKNASTVRIDPLVGAVQLQGSRLVNPSSSVTYTATAVGPGGSASDSARITVNLPAAAAPRVSDSKPAATVDVADLFRQNVQPIYFSYDDVDIRQDQIAKLNAAAVWLKTRRDVGFTIEGHCDDRGSEEYNVGLGDRRANRVKEFLIQQGVDESRIRTVSYGEERPACPTETEECYQRNRRADFVLASGR